MRPQQPVRTMRRKALPRKPPHSLDPDVHPWIPRIWTRPKGVSTIETRWETATMPSTTTAPPLRTRRRASHYPEQYSVCLARKIADTIESLCDTHDGTPGTLLRGIVGRGHEPTKAALASEGKRARRNARGTPRYPGPPRDPVDPRDRGSRALARHGWGAGVRARHHRPRGAQRSRLDIRVRPGRTGRER